MDLLSDERRRLERIIDLGGTISQRNAELFPDIILRRQGALIPDWALPYVRRPNQGSKSRYVVVGDIPFHVANTHSGMLVSLVSKYEQNTVHKVIHEPYLDNGCTHAAAVNAFNLVNEFVACPDQALKNLTQSTLGSFDASNIHATTESK
jgi:hypothetical protein